VPILSSGVPKKSVGVLKI